MQSAKFLSDQWEEALLSVCYVHNIVSSQRNFMCYEMWMWPNAYYFKLWGCLTSCKMIDQRGLISQRAI